MSQSPFDVDRAKLLIREISDNLAALPADIASHAELRAEVDALRAMLDQSNANPAQVADRMKSVHGLFDQAAAELGADGIRASMFLKEIGHMLGLR